MRLLSTLLFTFTVCLAHAQVIVLPDTALARKNKVKAVRVYQLDKNGKSLQKIAGYNLKGQMIMERPAEDSYYFTYTYDSTGRMNTITERTRTGDFVYRTVIVYNDKDSSRMEQTYFDKDTTRVARISTFDKHNRRIREEGDNGYGRSYVRADVYDAAGNRVSSYDSSSTTRIATVYNAEYRLVQKRMYDPKGKLLHAYRYAYHPNGQIATISDSTGTVKTMRYEMKLNERGEISEYWRDKKKMTEPQISTFKKEYYDIFPERVSEISEEHPAPDLTNEHHYTYDKNGNIIRDDLVQKWGTSSSAYVYVYEYEFY